MAMSKEHKEALVQGRAEAKAITTYLQAMQSRRPGRPVTAQNLKAKIAGLDDKIAEEADPLRRVKLMQTRIDALAALASVGEVLNLAAAEKGFVKYAKAYSTRKGLTYTAWREVGVPADILKKAGIARTRRR